MCLGCVTPVLPPVTRTIAIYQHTSNSYYRYKTKCLSGWWFGTFFIFPYIGNNHPNWLTHIFFQRGRSTTNQLSCRPPVRIWSGHQAGEKHSKAPESWYCNLFKNCYHRKDNDIMITPVSVMIIVIIVMIMAMITCLNIILFVSHILSKPHSIPVYRWFS